MAQTPNIDLREDYGRNYIINGSMDFWQRGTVFTSNGALYTMDRFLAVEDGTGTRTLSRSTDTPTSNSTYSMLWAVDTADAVLDAADLYGMEYRIEGYDLQPLLDKTITLSFWTKSNVAGAYTVSFSNAANDRSYVTEYTISSPNTWEKQVITLTHDATGTWDTDSGNGMRIRFGMGTGTDKQTGTLNQWQAGDFRGTSNAHVNIQSIVANTFQMAEVQLVEGSEELPFRRAGTDFDGELRLCRRYFETSYPIGTAIASLGSPAMNPLFSHGRLASTSNRLVAIAIFAVEKRAIPSRTIYDRDGVFDRITIWNTSLGTPTSNLVYSNNSVTKLGISIRSNDITSYGGLVNPAGIEAHWVVEAEI